jgi:hypothetical protein
VIPGTQRLAWRVTQFLRASLGRGARAALFLLVAAMPLLPAAAEPTGEPLPLVRKYVEPERIPQELERARQGILVRLPRADFEKKVKQAAQASTAADPPRLVKARYRAELDGAALVGRGDWTVINPAPAGGLLPLPELRLPLVNVKVDGNDAVLGALDGKAQGLWVEKTGLQTVAFDWSLRGSLGIGETHFELQVPAAASASLDLTLPADYQVTVPRDTAVLTGPDFAGRPEQRLWQISFPGRARVALVVRRVAGPGAVPPLILSTSRVRQLLSPGRLQADYRLNLEVLHQPVRELVFDCGPSLQPAEVTCASPVLKDWELQAPPAAAKGSPARGPVLVVRFREPVQGPLPLLQISCQGQLTAGAAWTSPALQLRNALSRGETLEVRVHPDIDLEAWSSGGFRLQGARAEADGTQVFQLIAGNGEGTGRPGGRLKEATPEASVRQAVWWQIGPPGMTLTTELSYQVVRGRLFRLALALPPAAKDGWQLEGVDLVEPKGLLDNWVTTTEKGQRVLLVALRQSLPAQKRARLVVRLRAPGPRAGSPAAFAVPFPTLAPPASCALAGALGISIDPLYQVKAVQSSGAAGPPLQPGPWGKAVLEFYYEFRDRPPTGHLRLLPHRPVLHATCRNEVLMAAAGANLKASLTLDPVVGALDAVELYVSVPADGTWQWQAPVKGSVVHALERLPLREVLPDLLALGGANPLNEAAALAACPPGSYWRLTFSRPLVQRESITLEMLARSEPGRGPRPWTERDWQVPLVSVPGADRLQGEAVLQVVGAELRQLWATGIELSSLGGPGPVKQAAAGIAPETWRSFRFGFPSARELPGLQVRLHRLPAAADPREMCDHARLTSRLDGEGRLVHFFSFRMCGWRSHTLPVGLPPGAQVVAAQVEGRWIERLPQEDTEQGPRVLLPVPAAIPNVHYQMVYTTAGPSLPWAPWSQLDAPAPRLPVTVFALSRTWQLPPGLTPLSPSVRRLPFAGAPLDEGAWELLLKRGWRAGDALLTAAGPPFSPEDWATAQRQLLEDAEAALRKEMTPRTSCELGPGLERLVLGHLRGAVPLVIDASALRGAGIGPATVCSVTAGSVAFWEAAGLVQVPCRAGALLTTRGEARRWQAATGSRRLQDDAIDDAVRQALQHGHDSSGRFWSVAAWTRDGDGGPSAADEPSLRRAEALSARPGNGWTEWTPVAGGPPTEHLIVLSGPGVAIVGLAVAALLLLLAWRLRRPAWGRWRLRFLLAWLGASIVAVLWLPGPLQPLGLWPALAGLVVALVWYLRQPRSDRAGRERGSSLRLATPAAVLLLALAALWPVSQAQEASADIVLILPPSAGADSKESVLVSPDLLKKLTARAAPPGIADAVLISARYEGAATAAGADMRADYQVYCGAEKVVVTIPLDGVDLKEGSLLEGAFVYPVAVTQPQPGYAVSISGRKGQLVKLSLPFHIRLTTTGASKELSFKVPRLAQSQLDLTLPAGARLAQAVTALGQQRLEGDGRGLPRLRANLGFADFGRKDSAVHVHWHQPTGPATLPVAQVNEFYLWDLRPPVSDLTAVLKYNVTAGAVSELVLALPDHVEVRSVEAATQPGARGLNSQARLTGWEVIPKGGKRRRLTLHLSEPVTGVLQVTLGLVPRAVVSPGNLALVLPTPVRPVPQKEKSLTGMLAYRLEGLEAADRPYHLGVINVPFAQFARQWQELGMRELGAGEGDVPTARAYSFRRTLAGSALELTLTAPQPAATASIAWQVAAGHLDLEASARVTAAADEAAGSAEGFSLVEWEVPPAVTIAQVSGTDVFRWGRSGSRLQVWLREPRKQADLRLGGWVPLVAGRAGTLTPPCVRLLSPRPTHTEMRLSAGPTWALHEVSLKNLRPLAASPFSFEAVDAAGLFGGTFRVIPATRQAEAHSLSLLEARAGLVTFTSRVLVDHVAGKERDMVLRLHGWPGAVHLEAVGLTVREQNAGAGQHVWKIHLHPTSLAQYALKLSGLASLGAGARLEVPHITMAGARCDDRWVAILGNDFKAEKVRGLTLLKDTMPALARWPVEAELIRREGVAWKVHADGWRLTLTPRAISRSSPVTVLLAEQSVAALDGEHWQHEAAYTLLGDGGTELGLALPTGAHFLTASVDGRAVVPRPAGPDGLLMPLPGQPGAHTLRIRWQMPAGHESLDRPRLEAPRLAREGDHPVLWNVLIPPGYHLMGAPARTASPARRELERASAQLQLLKLLAARRQAGDELEAAQQELAARARFLGHCRRAEADLLADGRANDERGPLGQTLPAWLEELRRQARHIAGPREPKQASAPAELSTKQGQASLALLSLEERGTPVGWRTGPGERPPAPRLLPLGAVETRDAVLATELLVAFLLGLWILSHLPRVAAGLRRLWPEQLLLLALLGWQAFGPSLVGAVLVLLALAARFLATGRWLHARMGQQTAAAALSASGNATAAT